MSTIQELMIAMTPSLLVGIVMFYFNKKQNKHFKEVEKRADDRRRESMLGLQLTMANGKLAYAVAVAVKRGTPNGEIEEGIEAYETIRREYVKFLNEQAIENIHS